MKTWLYGCDECQDACPMNRDIQSAVQNDPGLEKLAENFSLERVFYMDENEMKEVLVPKFWFIRPENLWIWKVNALRAMANSNIEKYREIFIEARSDENSDENNKRSDIMKKLMKVFGLLSFVGVFTSLLTVTAFAAGADPTGASYVIPSGVETLSDVAMTANKAYLGSNFVWVMITGFMVFFFQCGFAMVETGFCRGKNAAHTMTMNFMVFLVGAVGYFLLGFALQFGGSGGAAGLGSGGSVLDAMLSIPGLGGILGYKGFALSGTYDAGIYALFFFQMVFMDTTVTIPTGSMAERVKYSAVVITSFFVSLFLYPLFGNWVWGGGWLATLGKNFGLGHGVVDFAGSAVVHSMGGMLALAGAIVIQTTMRKSNSLPDSSKAIRPKFCIRELLFPPPQRSIRLSR